MIVPAAIGVLGPLQVRVGDSTLNLSGERSRRILVALVDAGENGASIDRLASAIWDDHDRPAEPTAHVRTAISRLRRTFGDAGADGSVIIESRPGGGYRLGPAVDVDARSFESGLADRSRTEGSYSQRLSALEVILDLWRGDPYVDLSDLLAFGPTITRLTDLKLAAEEERLGLLLFDGKNQLVVARAGVLVIANPWREELHRLHALALYRSGRQTDALAALRDHATSVRDELGLDPGPALVDLETAILNHDSELTEPEGLRESLRGYRVHETLHRSGGAIPTLRRRATQKALDASVIIETIDLASDPALARVSEVTAWVRQRANLKHPSIEPVLDYWRDPGSMHVVLPLYPRSVEDELAVGNFDLARLATVAAQLGPAVDAAHAAGLPHGRIEAGAVFCGTDGSFVLGCFPPLASEQDVAVDIAGLARLVAGLLAGAPTDNVDSLERLLAGAIHPTAAADLLVAAQQGGGTRTGEEFATRFIDAIGVEIGVDRGGPVFENPYPGLASFDESTSADFHGREAIVDELCDRWRDPEDRLLVVTGASGSGKSSVLLAGLIPALRAGVVEGSNQWAVAVMNPGSDPMQALTEAIAAVAVGADSNPAKFLDRNDGDQSVDRLGAAIAEALDADTELVLVIDQFEELFSGTEPHAEHSANEFLDLLAIALDASETRVRVAVSLRADWLDRPLQRQPFAAMFRRSLVPIAPLTAQELERSIGIPATDRGVAMTRSLQSRLVEDVLAESSALPLLGIALRELWNSRSQASVIDLEDYERLGGLTGALVGRAETLVESLGEHGAHELRRLFGKTVAIEPGRRPVRRTATLAEVLSVGVSQRTVDAAVEARLVAIDRDPATREPTLMPTHEAVLERWPRLAEWLREDRVRLHEHQRLAIAAVSWNDDQRDGALLLRGTRLEQALELRGREAALSPVEADFVATSETEHERLVERDRRQAQRRRNLTIVACVVAIVALLAGVLAVVEGRRAEQAATTAEIRLMTQSASAQFDERPALGLHLALGAIEHGGGPDAEAVLIELLGRAPFDRQLGTAVDTLCTAMSSDASRLAVVTFAAAGADGRSAVTSWDVNTGEASVIGQVEIPTQPCPALSPDGERLAVVAGEAIRVVELRTGATSARPQVGRPRDIEWTLDGSALIALFDDDGGRIEVLDADTLAVDRSIGLDTDFSSQVVATARDGVAVVTSDGRPPLVIDLDRRSVREIDEAGQPILTASINRDGTIVTGRSDTDVVAWNLESGGILWRAPHGSGDRSFADVVLNASGSHVATSGTEGVVIIDAATGAQIAEPLPISTEGSVMGFSGDDELIVTGAGDRINVLRVGPRVHVVHDDIAEGAVSPDGAVTTLLGDSENAQAILVSPSGERTQLTTGPSQAVPIDARTVVGYEVSERRFVMWIAGERLVDVDLSDRLSEESRHVRTMRIGHGLIVQQVMDPFPDPSTIVTFVFEEQGGKLLAELKTPGESLVMPIAPNRLAMANLDFAVRVTDLEGTTIQEVASFGHPITAIAASSDGALLIGLGNGTVHRHALSETADPQLLVGPPSAVMQILNFDGGFVTAHQSGAVVKWYDNEERPAGTIHAPVGFAGFGAVSLDQEFVLYPEPGRVVRVPLGRDAFIADGCRRSGLEIDRVAWSAITTTNPDLVEDLCRDSLAG